MEAQKSYAWKEFFPAGNWGEQFFPEFATRAQAVSGEVFRAKTGQEAAAIIVKILKDIQTHKLVVIPSAIQTNINLVDTLVKEGFTVYTQPKDVIANAKIADAGITEVEFGVAETGSVIENSFAVEKRMASELPPVHIALMPTSYIVPTVASAMETISKTFNGGYLSWITGPSRTADIERVLTIGVHGPSRMIVLCVDDTGAGSLGGEK